MTTPHRRFSQRAIEEAEDLLAEIDRACIEAGISHREIGFRLDGTDNVLSRSQAMTWMKESVDAGYPRIGFRIEPSGALSVVVNLAAYEDPDSQYHP